MVVDVRNENSLTARALQLAERIDLKGLERPDQFSSSPLAFRAGGGTAVLFLSVALAYDERRIGQAFDRVVPIAASLKQGRLLRGRGQDLLQQIGEALLIQQRLAGRVELADRPDVLWDPPELERMWGKLTDEYDLGPRARAIGQRLEVIRETADTMADLLSTRTSHRLEWYIIILICLELVIGLVSHVFK
jgi:uncharacterized Rmd1/YagE family protein